MDWDNDSSGPLTDDLADENGNDATLSTGLHGNEDVDSGITSAASSSLNLSDTDETFTQMVSLVDEEPRTIRELHDEVGKDAGLTRGQTRYRAEKLADAGLMQSKKAGGDTSPRILYRD